MEELPQLKSAGRQSIQCFGELAAVVCFGGRRFPWTFLLAAVEEPLLGSDFLKHYKLAVDLASKSLLEAGSMQSVAVGSLVVAGRLATLRTTPLTLPQLGELLRQFPEVLSESGKLRPLNMLSHIPSLPRAGQSPPNLEDWMPGSWRQRRRSSCS
jgi:hypothetical protein